MKRTKKKKVINDNAKHDGDTGSHQVQVALITEQIKELTKHLETHPKDDHSRRGLLMMVGKRRKLLNYLRSKGMEAYDVLLKKLDIRK